MGPPDGHVPPIGAAEMEGTPDSGPICLNRVGSALAAKEGGESERGTGSGLSVSTAAPMMGGSQMAEAAGLGHMASQGLGGREGQEHKGPRNPSATVMGALYLWICCRRFALKRH